MKDDGAMSINGSHRHRRPSVSRTSLILLILLVVAGLVLATHFLEKHSDLIGLIAILGAAVLIAAVAWLDAD
jgi:peptidoglycan/LPS O-acetylase OafA/YrhL